MLADVLNWFRRARTRTRAHHAAWAGQITPAPDGSTPFQRSCDAAVLAELSRLRLKFESRHEHRGKDFYVETRIDHFNLTVWIYADGADLTGRGTDLRLEHWDADSPAELSRRLCVAIREAVLSSGAGAV